MIYLLVLYLHKNGHWARGQSRTLAQRQGQSRAGHSGAERILEFVTAFLAQNGHWSGTVLALNARYQTRAKVIYVESAMIVVHGLDCLCG